MSLIALLDGSEATCRGGPERSEGGWSEATWSEATDALSTE
jgi:hypothetical protein